MQEANFERVRKLINDKTDLISALKSIKKTDTVRLMDITFRKSSVEDMILKEIEYTNRMLKSLGVTEIVEVM